MLNHQRVNQTNGIVSGFPTFYVYSLRLRLISASLLESVPPADEHPRSGSEDRLSPKITWFENHISLLKHGHSWVNPIRLMIN